MIKKYIAVVMAVILVFVAYDYMVYSLGWFSPLFSRWTDKSEYIVAKAVDDQIQIYDPENDIYQPFEIKGVNMGSGIPGKWSMDFAADFDTCMRWLEQIQEMGANIIRVYTIQSPDFYRALYTWNTARQEQWLSPLYLLQGVWFNDYLAFSARDALDPELLDKFIADARRTISVVHGSQKIATQKRVTGASGDFKYDVSSWTLGYLPGIDWNGQLVAFTNEKYRMDPACHSYAGTYMSAAEGAEPFEVMLARAGDAMISFEQRRFGTQKLIGFTNSMATDPFEYPELIGRYLDKYAAIDVEHLEMSEQALAGHFASYHIDPYTPNFLTYTSDWSSCGLSAPASYMDQDGYLNTCLPYLELLVKHHSIPVVIHEFGIPASRGVSQMEKNISRSQGNFNETEQARQLVKCWKDIQKAGSAGGIVYSWQDEWSKRTWNTEYAVQLNRMPYWSDYQSSGGFFGLLAFDPGKTTPASYPDGSLEEWKDEDKVWEKDGQSLSMKYDERFLYLMARDPDMDLENHPLYIPLDITPKSGSNQAVLNFSAQSASAQFENEAQPVKAETHPMNLTDSENYSVQPAEMKMNPNETDTALLQLQKNELEAADETEKASRNPEAVADADTDMGPVHLNLEAPADFVICLQAHNQSEMLVQERYEVLRANYSQEVYHFDTYLSKNIASKDSSTFVPIHSILQMKAFHEDMYTNGFVNEAILFDTGLLVHGNGNPDSPEYDSLADYMTGAGFVELRIPWQLINFSDPSRMEVHDDYYERYGIEPVKIPDIGLGMGNGEQTIHMSRAALKGWNNRIAFHERLKPAYFQLKEEWNHEN